MRNRRFTRLTDAFSKKLENLEHSVALHFFAYNFLTRHGTIRMPPALKAGVTDHWWTYEELVELIDNYDPTEKPVNWAEKMIPMDELSRPDGKSEA